MRYCRLPSADRTRQEYHAHTASVARAIRFRSGVFPLRVRLFLRQRGGCPLSRLSPESPPPPRIFVVAAPIAQRSVVASDGRDARVLCGWRGHASPMRAMRSERWRCASTARTSSDHEGRRGTLQGESGAAFAPELPEEGEGAGRVFLRVGQAGEGGEGVAGSCPQRTTRRFRREKNPCRSSKSDCNMSQTLAFAGAAFRLRLNVVAVGIDPPRTSHNLKVLEAIRTLHEHADRSVYFAVIRRALKSASEHAFSQNPLWH